MEPKHEAPVESKKEPVPEKKPQYRLKDELPVKTVRRVEDDSLPVEVRERFEEERSKNPMVLGLVKPKPGRLQKVSYILLPDGGKKEVKVREVIASK